MSGAEILLLCIVFGPLGLALLALLFAASGEDL